MNKWQDSSFSLKWTCVLSYLGELAIMKHDYRHEHSWDTNMETGHGHGDGYGTQKFSTWGYASFCFRIVFFFQLCKPNCEHQIFRSRLNGACRYTHIYFTIHFWPNTCEVFINILRWKSF